MFLANKMLIFNICNVEPLPFCNVEIFEKAKVERVHEKEGEAGKEVRGRWTLATVDETRREILLHFTLIYREIVVLIQFKPACSAATRFAALALPQLKYG